MLMCGMTPLFANLMAFKQNQKWRQGKRVLHRNLIIRVFEECVEVWCRRSDSNRHEFDLARF
jgi:hypothetical protein